MNNIFLFVHFMGLGRALLKFAFPAKRWTSIGGAKACACLPAGRLAPGMSLKRDAKTKACPERSNMLEADPCLCRKEFEERVGQMASPKGAKTELIISAIENKMGIFRVADIQKQCPGVSIDMIRRVMKTLQTSEKIKCLGRGQNAQWQKTEKW